MLRLQGDACVGSVEGPAGTAKCSVESVPGVELDPWLAGPDLNGSRASSVSKQGGSPELLVAVPPEDVVMVVAAGEPELVTRISDPLTNVHRLSKVEWCSID